MVVGGETGSPVDARVQEFVGDNAEKTATAAKQIADKMSAEVREFTEFMKKMNDGEKTRGNQSRHNRAHAAQEESEE